MILSTPALSEVGLSLAGDARYASRQGCFPAKAHTMSTNRYRWAKPSDLPERVELIDIATSRQVAVITNAGRNWQWQRKTTVLLHGAPPAEGMATSLTQAKIRVMDGLPNEG